MPIFSNDLLMIRRSQEAQKESHDPHRQVGVVIADTENNVVSVGTNAPPNSFAFAPARSRESIAEDINWKYYMLEHAERNAIFSALKQGRSLEGATMYSTLYPCADCARAIAASGIRRLVVPEAAVQSERDDKWLEHYKYAKNIFELSGVKVDHFELDELRQIEANFIERASSQNSLRTIQELQRQEFYRSGQAAAARIGSSTG